jgi:hypothetical protein
VLVAVLFVNLRGPRVRSQAWPWPWGATTQEWALGCQRGACPHVRTALSDVCSPCGNVERSCATLPINACKRTPLITGWMSHMHALGWLVPIPSALAKQAYLNLDD